MSTICLTFPRPKNLSPATKVAGEKRIISSQLFSLILQKEKCLCFNGTIPTEVKVNSSLCGYSCRVADQTESCGGETTFSVYSKCKPNTSTQQDYVMVVIWSEFYLYQIFESFQCMDILVSDVQNKTNQNRCKFIKNAQQYVSLDVVLVVPVYIMTSLLLFSRKSK